MSHVWRGTHVVQHHLPAEWTMDDLANTTTPVNDNETDRRLTPEEAGQ